MKSSPKTVRLAIVGTGAMANSHALHFKKIPGCRLVGAVDIDRERVGNFCQKHDIPASFASLTELLERVEIDAVSIATPDAFHAPLSIQSLKAGKHVFCEKPLALTYPEALKMVAAARQAGKINMVNFTHRNGPVIHAAAKAVKSGLIGEIRHLEASYLQAWLSSKIWGDWRTNPAWLWRLSTRHGSQGVLGDIGVHILDYATLPAGPITSVHCRLKTFPKAPRHRLGVYTLDANDSAALTVEFKNGGLGVIHTTRFSTGHANRLFLKISGTKGALEIDTEVSTTRYRICTGANVDKAQWEEVEAPPVPTGYERFINGILTGKQDQPDFSRGAEIQKIIDACYVSDAEDKTIKL
jgi:predicted dehydrogenase